MSNPKNLLINRMGELQLKKLSLTKNITKAHWLGMSFSQLFNKLEDEINELRNAIVKSSFIATQDIIDECVDICNFATMIAHKAGGLNCEHKWDGPVGVSPDKQMELRTCSKCKEMKEFKK